MKQNDEILKSGGCGSVKRFHLRECARVHRRGLDVQHHAVYERFGTGHKTDPEPEIKTHS